MDSSPAVSCPHPHMISSREVMDMKEYNFLWCPVLKKLNLGTDSFSDLYKHAVWHRGSLGWRLHLMDGKLGNKEEMN
jgi:hypothetical protein